jgi:hypothetical protein
MIEKVHYKEICSLLGMTHQQVYQVLKKYGIKKIGTGLYNKAEIMVLVKEFEERKRLQKRTK